MSVSRENFKAKNILSELSFKLFTGVRRDLTEDMNKVQRTSGWVAANQDRFAVPDTRSLKLKKFTKITNQTKHHQEMSYQRQISYGFKTPEKNGLDTSFNSSGSPRLKAFEGDAWKRSPRTGM